MCPLDFIRKYTLVESEIQLAFQSSALSFCLLSSNTLIL